MINLPPHLQPFMPPSGPSAPTLHPHIMHSIGMMQKLPPHGQAIPTIDYGDENPLKSPQGDDRGAFHSASGVEPDVPGVSPALPPDDNVGDDNDQKIKAALKMATDQEMGGLDYQKKQQSKDNKALQQDTFNQKKFFGV